MRDPAGRALYDSAPATSRDGRGALDARDDCAPCAQESNPYDRDMRDKHAVKDGRVFAPPAGWPARLLGLDVGSVRVGVAISDPTGCFAEPLAVLSRWPVRGRPTAAAQLAAWAAEHKIKQVVVGRPLRMNGEEGLAVAAVEATAEVLCRGLDLEVVWWDERLSSREAERMMIACGVRRDKRRQRLDMVAASLILQSYLDARRSPLGVGFPSSSPGR